MDAKRSSLFVRQALVLALIALVLFGAVGPVSAAGTVRRAKPTGLNSGSCLTWATACTLARAWVVAVAGDQIWVVKGTYKPTVAAVPANPRTRTFTLKNGVAVYGGFLGTETLLSQRKPAVSVTILSGELGAAGTADNSYHVVTASGMTITSTAVLDGFTITSGNANGTSPNNNGGGMYSNFASPMLRNLVFSANSAGYGGGLYNNTSSSQLANVTFKDNRATYGAGMYNYQGNLKLTNVTFTLNKASGATDSSGGGMYNHTSSPALSSVAFSSNSATDYGGGMYNHTSSPTLTNVTFSGNTADFGGGGMDNEFSSSPTLTNVTFSGNSATNAGGGMYNYQSSPTLTQVGFSGNSAAAGAGMLNLSSSPTLTSVTFSGNSASDGGGMYNYQSSPTLTNVTFSSNSGTSYGGGMSNFTSSSPTLTNVTFSGNTSSSGGGISNISSSASIKNSILWGDATGEIKGASTITDSIVQGGCSAGMTCTNVLNADPKLGPLQNNGGFTQTMALQAGSAAIDTGGVNALCAPKDQRGYPRPQDGNGDGKRLCDMGAYEAPAIVRLTSIPAQDGWVLETGETTNVGGKFNPTAPTLAIGDDVGRRQFRAVLSFNTAGLPDDATIVFAGLILTRESIVPLGTNPFTTLQGLMIDVRTGYFGAAPSLEAMDFQAAASRSVGPFQPAPVGAVYNISLPSGAYPSINKLSTNSGLTQLRLRFKLDDDNDAAADYISFFSGDHLTPGYRPVLTIAYYEP